MESLLDLQPTTALTQAQQTLHKYEQHCQAAQATQDTAVWALMEAQAYAAVAQAQAMTRIAEVLEQQLEDAALAFCVPAKHQWKHPGQS